jgi:hypothetical protein
MVVAIALPPSNIKPPLHSYGEASNRTVAGIKICATICPAFQNLLSSGMFGTYIAGPG